MPYICQNNKPIEGNKEASRRSNRLVMGHSNGLLLNGHGYNLLTESESNILSARERGLTETKSVLDIDHCLYIHQEGLNIKQFYNLGDELGQGTYGVVKRSQRNCQATTQLKIQKLIEETETDQTDTQFTYAIK